MLRFLAIGADPRDWLPGRDTAAPLSFTLPAGISVGDYDLLLSLPDSDRRLASDPRYAIRIANADDPAKRQRWMANVGAFDLGTKLTVR